MKTNSKIAKLNAEALKANKELFEQVFGLNEQSDIYCSFNENRIGEHSVKIISYSEDTKTKEGNVYNFLKLVLETDEGGTIYATVFAKDGYDPKVITSKHFTAEEMEFNYKYQRFIGEVANQIFENHKKMTVLPAGRILKALVENGIYFNCWLTPREGSDFMKATFRKTKQ